MKMTTVPTSLFPGLSLAACVRAATGCTPSGGDDDDSGGASAPTVTSDTDGSETGVVGSEAGTGASTTTDPGTGESSTTGNASETGSSSTTGPSDGRGITSLEQGDRYTFAVGEDGALYGWGALPVVGGYELPVRFDNYDSAVGVTTGEDTFVLLDDGTAVEFNGFNEPTPIPLDDVVAVETGDEGAHCAIAGEDRALYCWGFSGKGVLGFDPEENPEIPTLVPGMTGVAEVSIGAEHSCARMETGVVRCTGSGTAGQHGDGVFANSRASFEDVPGATDIVDIHSDEDMTCGLKSSGELLCWGWTWLAILETPSPPIDGIPSAQGMLAEEGVQCVWDQAGQLYCWGFGPSGEVGNGETPSDPASGQMTPFAIEGLPPVVGGVAGTCAIVEGGDVYCWGENSFGQTGTGLPEGSVLAPTRVELDKL